MSGVSHYKITVLETHVDFYGHINNATYLELYEEARWDLITSRGYGFNEIMVRRQGPVVLDVHLKFLKEIRVRESITITTKLVKYEGKVGQMLQQMIKDDGTVASEALFTFGLFDMNTRKLIKPTSEWKKALNME